MTQSLLLSSLFSENVMSRAFEGEASIHDLDPREAELVRGAVEARQAHFAAGRLCAHSALEDLGANHGPVMWDDRRAPVWPTTAVGSITHTKGFCGAVAALRTKYAALGIDAERIMTLQSNVQEQIFTHGERNRIRLLAAAEQSRVATAIFSAKESLYKCQYQLARSWLGFQDVEIRVAQGWFMAEILTDVGCLSRGQRFKGRLAGMGEIIVSGIAFPCVTDELGHPEALSGIQWRQSPLLWDDR